MLCAIEREIGASLRSGLDHQVAHARLAWWREECARCARRRTGASTHARARRAASRREPAAALGGLAGLIDYAVWDLAAATFETRRELRAYCERWSAAMIEPLVRLAAPGLAPARRARSARHCASWSCCSRSRADARAGRLRLPLDELGRGRGPLRKSWRSRRGRRSSPRCCARGIGNCARALARSVSALRAGTRGRRCAG